MRFVMISLVILLLGVLVTIGILLTREPEPKIPPSSGQVENTPVPSPVHEITPLSPASTPRAEESPTPRLPVDTPRAEESSTPRPERTPATPLKLDVNTDRQQYRIGQKMTVTVSTTQPCYLLLYGVDSQGVAARFFPNSLVEDPRIQENVQYRIPEENAPFDIEIIGPAGSEYIHAFCSRERLSTLYEVYQTGEAFQQALREHVYPLPAEQWTETKVSYHVSSN